MPESSAAPRRRYLGINQRDAAETIAVTVEGLRQVGRL